MALSDVVVVMNRGEIEQTGGPKEVFQEPATLFAARFLGCSNVIPGHVATMGGERAVTVEIAGGVRISGSWRDATPPKAGEVVDIAFRPGVVTLGHSSADPSNTLEGQVLTAAFLGHSVDYTIKVGDMAIRAETSPDTAVPAGSTARLHISARHAFVYRRSHGVTPEA